MIQLAWFAISPSTEPGLYSVLNHIWQSTLFAAVAALLALALRNSRARVRYGLWAAASFKFLIPFAALIAAGAHFGGIAPHPRPELAVAIEWAASPLTVALPSFALAPAAPALSNRLPLLLLLLWAVGFAAIMCHWCSRWLRLRAVAGRASPLDVPADLPARNHLQVMSAPGLLEPGVFGFFRQRLLVPAGILHRLSPAQFESVLAHEMCHMRYRDNLASALHMFVQALFWFHPLVWWIGARLVDERERACDEAVLLSGSEPRVYAESILQVCRFYVESPLVCVAGITGSNLKQRIEGIMTRQVAQNLGFTRKLLLAALACASLAGPIAIGLLHAVPGRAQSSPAPAAAAPQFEVASIKPSKGNDNRIGFMFEPGGRFNGTNVTMKFLIQQAYGVRDFQIVGGPSWLNTDHYDIVAKAEGDKIDREQIQLMFQALLADRFQLTIHHETKELPIYVLVVAKSGSKLQESGSDAGRPQLRMGRGLLNGQGIKMPMLATEIARIVGRTVIDQTGLTAAYNLKLEWTPDSAPAPGGREGAPDAPPSADSTGPSLVTALQEQLGLKLESQRGPVDMIHIDRVEKPSAN